MNTELNREENDDIQHQTKHVINLIREWVQNPLHLDAMPNIPTLKKPMRLQKGKGTNVIVLT